MHVDPCRPSSFNVLNDDWDGIVFFESGCRNLAALGTDEGSIPKDVVYGLFRPLLFRNTDCRRGDSLGCVITSSTLNNGSCSSGSSSRRHSNRIGSIGSFGYCCKRLDFHSYQ